MERDIASSLMQLKGTEKDFSKTYDKKRKREANVSKGMKEEEEEVEVKERRSKKKHDAGSKGKKPAVEDEELEVRERRSKNKHDGDMCSRESVKNTISSPRKGKDKTVVEEGAKGKSMLGGKKVVVDFEKPSRKKRQLLDEDDDDFVDVSGPSRKQKGKGKEVKKAKKEVTKLMDVPMKMCYYVLERLDVEKREVVVENGVLDVSAESVHDMLWLPLGGTSFKDMPLVDEDDEDSCIMGICNSDALSHIKKDTNISSINWCEYVVECLVKTKRAYNPDKESSFFFSHAAYLALLYVDGLRFERMDVPRTRPAICFWSSEMIRVREDYEMLDGGFGLGEVNGKFVEYFVDISDDDEEDKEYEEEVQEEDEVDSDKESSEESRISIPDQFEFPIEHDHDEDAAISTPAFGQDGEDNNEEERDDEDDQDDGTDNEGNDDDGYDDDHEDDGNDGDAGMVVCGNDENEDEDVGGNGGNEEELTDLNDVVDNVVKSVFGSQVAIQVTQVESLNVQSTKGEKLETEKVEDESEVVENEVENRKEKESDKDEVDLENVKEKEDVVEHKEDENVVEQMGKGNEDENVVEEEKEYEGNLSIVVAENSNVGGEEKMTVIPLLSSSSSQEFWNSSAVEKLLLAATTQTSKAIEKSKEIEKKWKNLVVVKAGVIDAVPVSVVPSSDTKPASVVVKADVIDAVPVSVVLGKEKEGKKPTLALKSPFKERVVDPRAALTQRSECFFYENEHLDEERKYQIFKENFRLVVYGDKDLVVLKDVDLHTYLFVFNLAKPGYEGIDNSADKAEFLDKYEKVFTPLCFFLRNLFDIGLPKAFDMASEELTPKCLKMPWRTTFNKVDCGVFTMRHMETYFGEASTSKWKCGFTKEGNYQQKLLERLREKYAATMLLSRMNNQRDVILSQAREYCQKTDANVRSGDRFKAQFEITARLNAFG
ncbi:hypothetical protein LXL04_015565 [Taraxacum kok-saghyz]